MIGYVVVVERDEIGGYSGWSPDLLGCVATAPEYDECVRRMGDAVRSYVERLRADGDPVPEPTAVAASIVPAG